MSDNADFLFRQPSELIQVAERVEKRAAPRIATARRVSRLGIPERFAWFKLVSEPAVERKRLVGTLARTRVTWALPTIRSSGSAEPALLQHPDGRVATSHH